MGKKSQTVGSKKAVVQAWEGHYGTKSNMVVKDLSESMKVHDPIFGQNVNAVVAKDADGMYVTSANHVDSGMLDTYRVNHRINYNGEV